MQKRDREKRMIDGGKSKANPEDCADNPEALLKFKFGGAHR